MKAKTRIASFVAVVGSDSLEDFGLVPFLAQIKSFTRESKMLSTQLMSWPEMTNLD